MVTLSSKRASGETFIDDSPWLPPVDALSRERYYDPVVGKFISDDPIRQAGGLNMSWYVGNNPVSLVDPDGKEPIDPTAPKQVLNSSSRSVPGQTNNAFDTVPEGKFGTSTTTRIGKIYRVQLAQDDDPVKEKEFEEKLDKALRGEEVFGIAVSIGVLQRLQRTIGEDPIPISLWEGDPKIQLALKRMFGDHSPFGVVVEIMNRVLANRNVFLNTPGRVNSPRDLRKASDTDLYREDIEFMLNNIQADKMTPEKAEELDRFDRFGRGAEQILFGVAILAAAKLGGPAEAPLRRGISDEDFAARPTEPAKPAEKEIQPPVKTVLELAGQTGNIAETSPIEIPANAQIQVATKTGYTQVRYRWRDSAGVKYEARVHDRTPGAPPDTKPNWRLTRRIPGSGIQGTPNVSETVEEYIGDGIWIPKSVWDDAVNARKNNKLTEGQDNMLKRGHIEIDDSIEETGN